MRWGVRWWLQGRDEGWFYSYDTPAISSSNEPWTEDINNEPWTEDINMAFAAMALYQSRYYGPNYRFQVQEYR